MAEQVRIGLIGTGGISHVHVGHLVEIREAAIVGLVDPDASRTEAVKARFPQLTDCPTYTSHEDLLGADGLDAVIIASPHNVHCRQIVDSLQAGLHVMTEKPMVCSIEDAHTVMEEEKKASRSFTIIDTLESTW